MMKFSEVGQDLFVVNQLNGKRNGVFLDIGAGHPTFNNYQGWQQGDTWIDGWYEGNNTFLLERDYGWTGVCVDLDSRWNEAWKTRRAKFLNQNALEIDYDKLLSEIAVDGVVDYLSLDLEPASVTYECLLRIPFDKYRFSAVTYEHDSYRFGHHFRNESRELFLKHGYRLVEKDVKCPSGGEYEDWYVHESVNLP
jgi:hypothetical protein